MRIEISGGTAAIYADHTNRPAVIAHLLEAAGPGRTGVVRTVTGGNSLALSVPVEVARAAGLLPEGIDTPGEGEQPTPESKPDPAPESKPKAAPAKPRTAKKTEEPGNAE